MGGVSIVSLDDETVLAERSSISNQKVVLITGASSGVGQSTARLLSQKGFKVFGTSRNPAKAETIPGVEMLALDVRSDDSVEACVKAISRRVRRLDVLVNNAGYEFGGALEEFSIEEAKAQFETNFFGVIRVVKAVLPVMRKQKSGKIINISSLSGITPIPFMGIYSASKFALEGYTETLRHEVKPFNIHVSLIEPGFLKTAMMIHREVAAERVGEYFPWRQRAFNAIRAYEDKGPGPELVAESVLGIISSQTPRLRYVIGQQARSITRLRWFLPQGLYEQGTRRAFSLDKND
jgi:NAD(P)-dependent dehydrogenase (short-subunit alcohol dehydrogenase family)